jgi:pyruvate kinase
MRRTRILTTLGPATDGPDQIAALLAAGSDAFRLNFSHGTVDHHAEICDRIRTAARAAGRPVAILQDLGGPKIRIGVLADPLALDAGAALRIEQGDFTGGPGRVASSFDALFTSTQRGHRLLLDDGRIELEVVDVAPGVLTTRVVTGGRLESRKGINLPDSSVRTPALTGKDVDDLRAGVRMGVDLVALSFVQSAEDLKAARAAAAAAGAPDMPLIAKIEKPQAIDHLDEILEVADGLMIARGDLGIELPLERLPALQKMLVRAARRQSVPVIVATQVLETMRTEPRPTRAEVTDAAHAVDEGVDAIMLAGETAVGRYPVRAVSTLDLIVREAEKMLDPVDRIRPEMGGVEHGRALCEAAVTLAERARAVAVIALTEAGKTARLLAALRPQPAIVAATPSPETAARLSLTWGVTTLVAESCRIGSVRELLVERGLVPSGSAVVFVSMHPVLGREDTNFVHVERV